MSSQLCKEIRDPESTDREKGDQEQDKQRKIHNILSLFRDLSAEEPFCCCEQDDKKCDKNITDQKPYPKIGHINSLLGPRLYQGAL